MEDVWRQVAVAVVVAVEGAAFPTDVKRVVGGVGVEDQLRRRLPMGAEEEINEERPDRLGIVVEAAIAMGARGHVLQPVERRLARKRRAARPPDRPIRGAQKQGASVRGHHTAAEIGHGGGAIEGFLYNLPSL